MEKSLFEQMGGTYTPGWRLSSSKHDNFPKKKQNISVYGDRDTNDT